MSIEIFGSFFLLSQGWCFIVGRGGQYYEFALDTLGGNRTVVVDVCEGHLSKSWEGGTCILGVLL